MHTNSYDFLSVMKKINSLFIVFGFLVINCLTAPNAAAQMQFDIPSPQPGGEIFGTKVATLPNGNFVVTDPNYDAPGPITDAGRVYLYDGATLAIINTITGSMDNDQVGSSSGGLGGVIVLANGNYVVITQNWNNGAGAVTFCSGTTGCPSTISAANSLVGSTAGDSVGGSDGVTALPNGNYVVKSSAWDDGATADVGAVTFCNGTAGCTGAVSAANSLIGSTASDGVGNGGITTLSNSNYVVYSILWNNGAATFAGAVTWCSGTAGCTGAVSPVNSLVGATANEFVGQNGIFPLTNGGYVVCNGGWDNGATMDVGSATFCNSVTGCVGTVTAVNSLTGSAANDQVGLNGATILTNGNYVVRSQLWDNGATTDAGAATFCNGVTGCVGTVSPANSLVGMTASDGVGRGGTALTNGNYIVSSSDWDNPSPLMANVGAVTWCNGATGCTGAVSTANSLVGPAPGEALALVTALTNGNYVVNSPFSSISNSGAGAVTWCNGATGCVGTLTLANSLVGSQFQDRVGENVTALTNGNYVVHSPFWNTTDVGAATFCNGASGCVGTVSSANSLVGSTVNDRVGGSATPLSNGNYVVRSTSWDNGAITDAGAVTRCSGTTGCTGIVTAANSLVGSTADDVVGGGAFCGLGGVLCGVTALSNGNYLVKSAYWDNGALTDAGAVSYAFGNGATVGAITASNSVRGTTANGGVNLSYSFDSTNNQLVVGRPSDNIVTVFRPAPTAASVSVGGRVITPEGCGVARARVIMTDTNGNSRTALTNSFGYYRFEEVNVGQTYIISVRSKQYLFNPQVLTVLEEMTDLNFTAFPK
jgi:hypothetical protein